MAIRNKNGDKPSEITESDLAADRMGYNRLQAEDQLKVRIERHAVPDEKTETDDVIESLRKLDKDVRAKEDLGKKQD